MILCLDAGNTQLKWGVHAAGAWQAQGRLMYADLDRLIEGLPVGITRLRACNVAGPAIATRIEALAANLQIPLEWFRSSPSCLGVENGYETPTQLGADRWAALLGARNLHAGAALVVMAGTATTIDGLTAEGRFLGGLILPGLTLMRQSLARNTAGLPEARGEYRDWPGNTDDAIVTGTLQATLGAIDRMTEQLCRSASADFLCLLSGGAASFLAPRLKWPYRHVENLVLEGLARVP
jgi:type III pantothenate kinase